MLLAVDIGNTNISFGVFRGKKIIKRFNIPTEEYSRNKLKRAISRLILDDAIICSVVPNTGRVLERDLSSLLHKQPYYLGKNINVPIKNLYRKAKEVGQDRLANAFAGVKLYGAPLIIVDFGTAVTFDVISKNKEYLGGMIFPGVKISLDVLVKKAALLPKIQLSRPKEFIGRDTRSSMLSGIVYGFAALADDLVERIKEKIGSSAVVVGTGGDIDLIVRWCKGVDKIDKDLTLKGLNSLLKTVSKKIA